MMLDAIRYSMVDAGRRKFVRELVEYFPAVATSVEVHCYSNLDLFRWYGTKYTLQPGKRGDEGFMVG